MPAFSHTDIAFATYELTWKCSLSLLPWAAWFDARLPTFDWKVCREVSECSTLDCVSESWCANDLLVSTCWSVMKNLAMLGFRCKDASRCALSSVIKRSPFCCSSSNVLLTALKANLSNAVEGEFLRCESTAPSALYGALTVWKLDKVGERPVPACSKLGEQFSFTRKLLTSRLVSQTDGRWLVCEFGTDVPGDFLEQGNSWPQWMEKI